MTEYLNKNITVLFPGSYKPAHGGHLDLIKRYSELPEVIEIWVLVGPGIRGGISQKVAADILKKLTEEMPKVVIQEVPWNSPVLAAYKIMEGAESGCFALAASSKELENTERIRLFTKKHSPGGKFHKEGVEVIDLPIDVNPLLFEGRDDGFEGEPISATILRQDLIDGNVENFATGYPDSTEEQISYVWDTLEQTIVLPDMEPVLDESLHTSGTPTESSPLGYDRSQPGYRYKAMFPITEKEEDEDNKGNDWEWVNNKYIRKIKK